MVSLKEELGTAAMDVKSRAHKDGEYSLEDVQRCGKDEDTILVSILGVCYDVSSGKEFFGPSGPYRVYAGHDISYALAMMSLKASDVDKFDYKLDEDEDKQTLADWIAYFDVKYTRAGTVVDVHHPYSLADLPQGKDPHNFINAAHPSTSGTASNAERAAFDAALAAASSEGNEPTKLSSWLIAETNDLHEKALYGKETEISCGMLPLSFSVVLLGNFMQALMARNVPMDIYAKWLGCLYHVYTELEYQLDIHQNEALIKAVDDPSVLRRLPNIKVDLEHFFGADVARAVRLAPSLHTIRYVSRISDIAAKPHLLLVHHWVSAFLSKLIANGVALRCVMVEV